MLSLVHSSLNFCKKLLDAAAAQLAIGETGAYNLRFAVSSSN